MKELKVRIIDSKNRGVDICSAVAEFNIFSKKEALHPYAEEIDKSELPPDIFLLHTTNLKKNGEPSYDYLKSINYELKDALIVLYSGGSLEIEKQDEKKIIFKDEGVTWDFDVTDGRRFCIIEKPVNSLSDIPIIQALENYLGTRKDRDVFFKSLKYQGSKHIAALDILCQGYLMAGIAAGKIVDKEVEYLIGWDDKIKKIFPKAESDWEEGWEKVKNPQWWWDTFARDKESALKLMTEKIKLEWEKDRPDVFDKLFAMINGKQVDNHSIVVQVYRAISDKLRGRKCPQQT
jgi:hypothetical protein